MGVLRSTIVGAEEGELAAFTTEDFLKRFEGVRERTRRVARCIPEDNVEWAPRPGMFTLGDLVRHIAVVERRIWAETVNGRPASYTTHGRELADGRDAVLEFLDRMHTEAVALFRQMAPGMMDEKCMTPGGVAMTTWKWLQLMVEHEIHHRGQIYVYLAQLGVNTPALYGMTSEEVRARAASTV
jgi:uncharacterized damage-inducible protein DinB